MSHQSIDITSPSGDTTVGMKKFNEYNGVKIVQLTFISLVILFSITSIVLVSYWTTGSSSRLWIGTPTWTTSASKSVFAWHPILMIVAFTCFITATTTVYTVGTTTRLMKGIHFLLQTTGLVLLIFGITAIVQYKRSESESNLTSLHSWIGVCAIVLILHNYTIGMIKSLNFLFSTDENGQLNDNTEGKCTKESLDVIKKYHVLAGFIAVYTVCMAINSGIVDFLGDECNYKLPAAYTEINPAARYDEIPMGCRVGNGLGLCVYFALIAGAVVVYIKYVVSHEEAVAAAGGEKVIMMMKKEKQPEGYAYEEEVPALDRMEDSKEVTTENHERK